MVLREIAMLKSFLSVLSYQGLFISFFRDYRINTNPLSLEEHLKTADSVNVLMSSFYFIPNSDYGYDFWNKLQNRFNRYVKEKADEYPDEDIRPMKGKCNYLRENWDKGAYWKKESRIIASKRNGIDIPLDKMRSILLSREEQGIATDEERNIVKEKEEELYRLVEQYKSDETHDRNNCADDEFLSGFESFDVKKKTPSRHLKDDEISINTRGNKGRVTFNQKVTADILKRGSYEYCKLGRTKSGDVTLLFNDSEGINVVDGSNQKDKSRTINITLGNRDMCEKILTLLNIENKNDVVKVRIKLIAKTDDYEAYALTKIKD